MLPIRARKHRLPDAAYRGQKNVAFTVNLGDRKRLFDDEQVVEAMLGILQSQTEKHGCLVGIYCFMPDHLHLILCGQSDRSNAKKAMDEFKHKSGLWLHANQLDVVWQGDYYDHIIRRGEDWRRQVSYIYRNPVRKGLVQNGADWPFTGAIGFDLTELLIDSHF